MTPSEDRANLDQEGSMRQAEERKKPDVPPREQPERETAKENGRAAIDVDVEGEINAALPEEQPLDADDSAG